MEQKPQFTDEFCKYIFSDDEEKGLAQEMARKVSEIAEQRSMKKSVVKDFDGRIETLDTSINSISRKLQDHYEMRNISCAIEMDFENKTVRHIRTDTGEVASTRAMTGREVQALLDFEESKNGEGNQKGGQMTDEEIGEEMAEAATRRVMTSETSALT